MDIDSIHKYCGTKADIDLKPFLGVSKSTISKWRANGIPAERQAIFEVLSNGALKADLNEFKSEKLQTKSGVPIERQAIFQALSDSTVKADLASFKLRQPRSKNVLSKRL
ncbi:hypothetical protein ACTXJO_04450 [Psychrobacter celer]|uniref:hypothetical protein n=1 Tax=Psychrobacter celer TaxID=306572 RepID=UPI003FCFBF9F